MTLSQLISHVCVLYAGPPSAPTCPHSWKAPAAGSPSMSGRREHFIITGTVIRIRIMEDLMDPDPGGKNSLKVHLKRAKYEEEENLILCI